MIRSRRLESAFKGRNLKVAATITRWNACWYFISPCISNPRASWSLNGEDLRFLRIIEGLIRDLR